MCKPRVLQYKNIVKTFYTEKNIIRNVTTRELKNFLLPCLLFEFQEGKTFNKNKKLIFAFF